MSSVRARSSVRGPCLLLRGNNTTGRIRNGLYLLVCMAFLVHGVPGRVMGRTFHTGGPGECKECHEGGSGQLLGSDASSICLRCHEAPSTVRKATGYYVATNSHDLESGVPPTQMNPGGDFGYLKKTYRWNPSADGKGGISPGERHGHNIVALDYGYYPDTTFAVAPNGSYPAGDFSCISCHDPHAKIARGDTASGAYRMLGGVGYSSRSARGFAFTFGPPVAVAPRDYNRSEAVTNTRVAYGKGMSEWCSNCHPNGCSGAYGHPTCGNAKCGMVIAANYNAYVKSGNINGRAGASYTSLVPFEEGTDDRRILAQHANNDGSYTKGPDQNSNVMCLTCHRAHASAWDSIARWNMAATFLVYDGTFPGTDVGSPAEISQGLTSADTRRAYYDRPSSLFAFRQRSLCNKCHIRD